MLWCRKRLPCKNSPTGWPSVAVKWSRKLMEMGVMATITQSIDGDTGELVVQEFGHRVKRVSEADVEDSLSLGTDGR